MGKRQKIDIFAIDYVIVPVHLGVHWTMACIDIVEHQITFYDSMGSAGRQYLEMLKSYVNSEHENKKGSYLDDIDEWELISPGRKTPQQENGSDCGVFTICT